MMRMDDFSMYCVRDPMLCTNEYELTLGFVECLNKMGGGDAANYFNTW